MPDRGPIDIDRAALHSELDAYLDDVERVRPQLEQGDEHVITFSGGCLHLDPDGTMLTDFTITATKVRHL